MKQHGNISGRAFFLSTQAALFLFCIPSFSNAQGIILSQGQSFSHHFNLGYGGRSGPSVVADYASWFLPIVRDVGETDSFRLEMFEDSTSESPVFPAPVFTGTDIAFARTYFQSTIWNDNQGAIRLTVLSGTIRFESFMVYRQNAAPVPRYSDTWIFSTDLPIVPEPEPIELGLMGAVAILMWNWFKRHLTDASH